MTFLWKKGPSYWRRRGRADITVNSRSSLVWGTYLPDATTAGLADPSLVTTIIPGNITYSNPSSTPKIISNTEFQGYVYIQGAYYKFINCRFVGPVSPTMGTVQTRYAVTHNIEFEDCHFEPRGKNYHSGNLQGRGWKALRCDFSGGIDGCGPAVVDGGTRIDVTIQQCYIHDLLRYCPDPNQPSDNQSHADAIQWAGGLGLTLLGNRIEGLLDTSIGSTFQPGTYDGNGKLTGGHQFYPNPVSTSAIMINALSNVIQPGELIMQKNWIRGGFVGVNSIGTPSAWLSADGSDISENHFKNDQGYGSNNRWVGKASQVGLSIHDNYVWLTDPLDNSTPINPKVNV